MIDVFRTTPADLAHIARTKGRMGYVAAASTDGTAGQLRFPKAGERDGAWNQRVPGETRRLEGGLLDKLFSGLPKTRRRTDRERFRAMFNRLADTALDSYRRVGYAAWPTSIQAELKELAWKTGDPTLADFGGLDQIYKQVDALTRRYVVHGANRQKEKDRKKVTLDWHGHYSA